MPLVIRFQRGEYCPVIECDYCGEAIDDPKDGNYEFDWGGGIPKFSHKCCTPPRPNRPALWEELELLPVYLARNLGLKGKAYRDAEKRADLLTSLG